MSEEALVERLVNKADRLEVMRSLLGAVNASDLRHVQLSDATFAALVGGLAHDHPQVRWWCIQMLDHCPDPRAMEAIVPLLEDPVPRVRRNAAHALGCVACKPGSTGRLDDAVVGRLRRMAEVDPNSKVRAEAAHTLACRAAAPRGFPSLARRPFGRPLSGAFDGTFGMVRAVKRSPARPGGA